MAQDRLEAGQGKAGGVAGLHQVGLRLGQAELGIQGIEYGGRAGAVARLLHPIVLPRDLHGGGGQRGGGLRGDVDLERGRHVAAGRPLQILPDGSRHVAVDLGLGHRDLAPGVVPDRQRHGEGDRRDVAGTGEEAVIEAGMASDQGQPRQVVAPLTPQEGV